jgi:hypothetical protein
MASPLTRPRASLPNTRWIPDPLRHKAWRLVETVGDRTLELGHVKCVQTVHRTADGRYHFTRVWYGVGRRGSGDVFDMLPDRRRRTGAMSDVEDTYRPNAPSRRRGWMVAG